MQLFELVSPRLFRPLAGPNRAFYAELLLLLWEECRHTADYSILRAEAVSRAEDYFAALAKPLALDADDAGEEAEPPTRAPHTLAQGLLLQLRRTYRFPLADGSCHALRVDYNEWNRSGSEAEYAPQRLLRIMQAPAAETEAAAPVPMKPRKYTVPETLFPITVKKRDREAYVEKALRYVLEHDIEL